MTTFMNCTVCGAKAPESMTRPESEIGDLCWSAICPACESKRTSPRPTSRKFVIVGTSHDAIPAGATENLIFEPHVFVQPVYLRIWEPCSRFFWVHRLDCFRMTPIVGRGLIPADAFGTFLKREDIEQSVEIEKTVLDLPLDMGPIMAGAHAYLQVQNRSDHPKDFCAALLCHDLSQTNLIY